MSLRSPEGLQGQYQPATQTASHAAALTLNIEHKYRTKNTQSPKASTIWGERINIKHRRREKEKRGERRKREEREGKGKRKTGRESGE